MFRIALVLIVCVLALFAVAPSAQAQCHGVSTFGFAPAFAVPVQSFGFYQPAFVQPVFFGSGFHHRNFAAVNVNGVNVFAGRNQNVRVSTRNTPFRPRVGQVTRVRVR